MYINVKDCGAVGDGIADDYPAIQSALLQGQVLEFPPGTYGLRSGYIYLTSDAELRAKIPGTVKLIDLSDTGNAYLLYAKPPSNTSSISVKLRGIEFDGCGKTVNSIVTLHNAVNTEIEGCSIGNASPMSHWAMNIDSLDSPAFTVKAYNVLIENCDFHNAGAQDDLVAVTKGRHIMFRSCRFRNPQAGANSLLSISDGTFGDIFVDWCSFEDTTTYPNPVKGIFTSLTGRNMRITNCETRLRNSSIVVGGMDIWITDNDLVGKVEFRTTGTERARVTGNTIDCTTTGGTAVSVYGVHHTFANNTLRPATNGMFFNEASKYCRVSHTTAIEPSLYAFDVRGEGHVLSHITALDKRPEPLMQAALNIKNAPGVQVHHLRVEGAKQFVLSSQTVTGSVQAN
jgi:hypothetical protein